MMDETKKEPTITNPDATSEADTSLPEGPLLTEPTTAEAFATVREALSLAFSCASGTDAKTALALLERRMGAQERAIRDALAHGCIRDVASCVYCAALSSALTDAPPAFSLEEVRQAVLLQTSSPDTADGVEVLLSAKRGGGR